MSCLVSLSRLFWLYWLNCPNLHFSYGGERYEKRDMQIRVRQRFDELQAMDRNSVPWTVINAAQSINDVQADIWTTVQATLAEVAKGKELKKMWDSGSYDLSEP
jgi:dTMP kinase